MAQVGQEKQREVTDLEFKHLPQCQPAGPALEPRVGQPEVDFG